MIQVYAFRNVPGFAQGLVRDLRVRWALHEAGIPYESVLIDLGEHKGEAYRALQPFGQIPAYREDGLVLFETGAILLHLGERSEALLPADPAGKARATAWLIAALNSVEPSIQGLTAIDAFHRGQAWTVERRPQVEADVRTRLGELEARLAGREWLEDRFTVGDLMMTTVMRIIRHTSLLDEFPALAAHKARCEARPAFQRALADHMAPFAEAAPAA